MSLPDNPKILDADEFPVFEKRNLQPDPYIESVVEPSINASLINGFYTFDRAQILQATTPNYRNFLKESGYANLDKIDSRIVISRSILKWDNDIAETAQKIGMITNGNYGDYIVRINQTDARKLIEALDGKLLTTGLMYNLFLPYIKGEAQKGDLDAKATLGEMINKAEWLEDLIINQNKLKIKYNERSIDFQKTDGRFDRTDLNEFGYPTIIKQTGEFHYWYPKDNKKEMAVLRIHHPSLDLVCNGEPIHSGDNLGLRLAKFY